MEEVEILSQIRKCINYDIIITCIKFMQIHDRIYLVLIIDREKVIFSENWFCLFDYSRDLDIWD